MTVPWAAPQAGSVGWHRDIGMTEDMSHAAVFRGGIKICYCLTDFTQPRSGLTRFAQGSHTLAAPLPVDEVYIHSLHCCRSCSRGQHNGGAHVRRSIVQHVCDHCQSLEVVTVHGANHTGRASDRPPFRPAIAGGGRLRTFREQNLPLWLGRESALAHWSLPLRAFSPRTKALPPCLHSLALTRPRRRRTSQL